MDTQEQKAKILQYLEVIDAEISKDDLENATEEELLKYMDLIEKIRARLEML